MYQATKPNTDEETGSLPNGVVINGAVVNVDGSMSNEKAPDADVSYAGDYLTAEDSSAPNDAQGRQEQAAANEQAAAEEAAAQEAGYDTYTQDEAANWFQSQGFSSYNGGGTVETGQNGQ